MNNFFYSLIKYFNSSIGFGLLVLLSLYFGAPYSALACGVVAIALFVYGCYSMYKDNHFNKDFKKWLNNKRR